MKALLRNKWCNYALYLVLGFIGYLFLNRLYINITTKMSSAFFQQLLIERIAFVGLIVTSYGAIWELSKVKLPPQTRIEVLFIGVRTRIFLTEGVYFLFFNRFGLFTLYKGETEHIQKKEVRFLEFLLQDANGKLMLGRLVGSWCPGPSEEDAIAYEGFPEEDMNENAGFLLGNAALRAAAKKDYWTEIRITDLACDIEVDPIYITGCKKYGIEFTNNMLQIISGNLSQDDIDQFAIRITKRLKIDNPGMVPSDIATLMQIQMKLVQPVVIKNEGGTPAIARVNVGKP